MLKLFCKNNKNNNNQHFAKKTHNNNNMQQFNTNEDDVMTKAVRQQLENMITERLQLSVSTLLASNMTLQHRLIEQSNYTNDCESFLTEDHDDGEDDENVQTKRSNKQQRLKTQNNQNMVSSSTGLDLSDLQLTDDDMTLLVTSVELKFYFEMSMSQMSDWQHAQTRALNVQQLEHYQSEFREKVDALRTVNKQLAARIGSHTNAHFYV